MEIKCSHCEFCCDKEINMRKHINTKHSNEVTNTEGTRCDFMVDQNDMFQIEIVEGEMLNTLAIFVMKARIALRK